MVPFTNDLFVVTAQTGALNGNEMALNTPRDLEQVGFAVSVQGGTGGSFLIDGRNSPNDAWIQLDTTAANKQVLVSRMNYYRGRCDALAAGLSGRITCNVPLRQIVNGNFI